MVQTHQESLTIKLLPLARPLPPPSPQCIASTHPLVYKALPVLEQREGGERGRDKANRGVRLQRGKYLGKKSSVLRKFIPCAKICSMCLHTHAHTLSLSLTFHLCTILIVIHIQVRVQLGILYALPWISTWGSSW